MSDGAFDSGVSGYIEAEATVKVYFPISLKGEPDVSCRQCFYFRTTSRSCALNGEICEWPEKFVGGRCPLRPSLKHYRADEVVTDDAERS